MLENFIQQQSWKHYLDWTLWGNSGVDYFQALILFVGLSLTFKVFQVIILHRLEKLSQKTSTDLDDFLVGLVKSIKPPLYFLLALFLAIKSLQFTNSWEKIIAVILLIILIYQAIIIISQAIDYIVFKLSTGTTKDNEKDKEVVYLLGKIAKGTVWVIAVLIVLDNMGINITSVVAGLGIGGIAVAMAVKDVLSDLIASISIYMDKPFKVGERVKVGTESGTVKSVGIKTTRIKTLSGEELVVPNKQLAESQIKNLKKMDKRRVKFTLGVVYGLPANKIESIPSIIKTIIETEGGDEVEFSRSHFATYGDFSLNFETVYFVKSNDYGVYMDIQQKINLAIYKKFEEENIEFAYPTQVVYVQNEN